MRIIQRPSWRRPERPAKPTPIAASALQTARAFFEQQGACGYEGTAMLAGTTGAGITRCVIPDQRPRRLSGGVSVEVTDDGKLELAAALALEERWLARIHSHPAEALHSHIDDVNPALTANGALSIVVPFFGLGLRRGLEACAVHVYTGSEWIALAPKDLVDFLVVV
jgi:hypothetical protein